MKSLPLFPRQFNDYSYRLQKGWLDYLRPVEQQWIGQNLFNGSNVKEDRYRKPIEHWYHPPKPEFNDNIKIQDTEKFITRRFFFAPQERCTILNSSVQNANQLCFQKV